MGTRGRWSIAAAGLLAAAFSGCGGSSSSGTDFEPSGCSEDSDCKGDRICDDGQCVAPGGTGGSSGSAGTSGSGGSGASSGASGSSGSSGSSGAGGSAGSSGSGGSAGSAGSSGGGGMAGGGAGGTGGTAGSSGSGGSGGGGGTGAIANGPPINSNDDEWTWVDFQDAKCRNGSSTGIGVRKSASSDNVVIFLEGGGACFNFATCLANPSSFGESSFNGWRNNGGQQGLFDTGKNNNPVKDWNHVYVPYCTGDVHAGDKPDGTVGSGSQVFVGYSNMTKFLHRIAATFPNAPRVLLTGVSAGGFGAAANYAQVVRFFSSSTQIDLLDDSGPPMDTMYVPECLQQTFRTTWNLDATVIADCGSACSNPDGFLLDFFEHLSSLSSTNQVGLIESTEDGVIRTFYGYGNNNCNAGAFPNMPASSFEAGLFDAINGQKSKSNFHSYVFTGGDHTSLGGGSLYSRTSNGTALIDWVNSFMSGNAGHVAPN